MPMKSSGKVALVEFKYGGVCTEHYKDRSDLLVSLLTNTGVEDLQKLIEDVIPQIIADQIDEENEEPEPLDSEDE